MLEAFSRENIVFLGLGHHLYSSQNANCLLTCQVSGLSHFLVILIVILVVLCS